MLALLRRKETWIMLALGFAAGLPILLVYSTLSTWLREAGANISAIGWFSLIGLAYGFKFLWAPLLDRVPFPLLSPWLGHRRGWLLATQLMLLLSLLAMSALDPQSAQAGVPIASAFIYGGLLIAISSASQDINIDAIRVELAEVELQAWLSGVYIAGYRIGMLIAGAGGLYLATYFGSTAEHYQLSAWQQTYQWMAAISLVGIITTLLIREPAFSPRPKPYPNRDYLGLIALFAVALSLFFIGYTQVFGPLASELKAQLISESSSRFSQSLMDFLLGSGRFLASVALAAVVAVLLSRFAWAPKTLLKETLVEPFQDLLTRFGKATGLILLVIISYRLTDIVMGVLANPFYIDTGFSKTDIATVTKVFGLLITIVGGFLGGWVTKQYGVFVGLFAGGVLAAATNLTFAWLAHIGANLAGLYLAIGVDNLAAGMAGAAFVAFLSALTNRSFTATQYATLFALTAIFPKLVAAKSGEWVELLGYSGFFILTAVLGLPTLVFLLWLKKRSNLLT